MSVVSDCGRVDSYSIISDMNMQILFLEKIISLLRFSGFGGVCGERCRTVVSCTCILLLPWLCQHNNEIAVYISDNHEGFTGEW